MGRVGTTDGLHITSFSTPALLLILPPSFTPLAPQHLEAEVFPPQVSLVADSPAEAVAAGNDQISRGIFLRDFFIESHGRY